MTPDVMRELATLQLEQLQATAKLLLEMEVRAVLEAVRKATPDNPCLKGFKVYSQCDEDGVIEEIFRRIGGGRSFLEIGCGDGLQNNSHYLLLKGWRGTWVEGNAENVARINAHLPRSDRLRVLQQWVDADNVRGLLLPEPDFLSLDIDGNDLHVMRSILQNCRPKVMCVEYNAKFRPPLAVTMQYNPKHGWAGDDYQGASLQALADAAQGYQLVSCNISGVNAFFVRQDLAAPFTAYGVAELYQPHRFPFIWMTSGHPPSYGFLRDALGNPDPAWR